MKDSDQQLTQELQAKYRIQRIHPKILEKVGRKFENRLILVAYGASMATYFVDIGAFRLSVKLLNLPGKVCIQQARIGQGGFGAVFPKTLAEKEFVAKVCLLNKDVPKEVE